VAYVQVPKDITEFTPKSMFGLTSRQLVCLLCAAIVIVPCCYISWLLTKNYEYFVYIAFAVGLPFWGMANYKKQGLPLEKFLVVFIKNKLLYPPIRLYKNKNAYLYLSKDLGLELTEEEIMLQEKECELSEKSFETVSKEKRKKWSIFNKRRNQALKQEDGCIVS